ncbi:MAG: class I SAM-dependent methyltransferase [Halieaceae bacterium]|nr:class I SAM-dependent methyltransferase [Halieaceae bacterium]
MSKMPKAFFVRTLHRLRRIIIDLMPMRMRLMGRRIIDRHRSRLVLGGETGDVLGGETIDAKSIWNQRYSEGKSVCTQNRVAGDPIDYTQHPFLWKHSVAKQLTGSSEGDPQRQIASQFLSPPAERILSIGAGMAFAEEWLVSNGFAKKIVAYEYSSVAVEAARTRLKQAGLSEKIEMRCGDVMTDDLETGSFDVVFVQAAIHHFYQIDEMFELMHRVLRPGGLLIYDEYVGPDHHLYESEVVDIMDEINDCLAEGYRWDVMRKEIRTSAPCATLEQMLQMDPSEGVHASRILPLTYKWFDVVYRGDYGGTIMRPFWVGILPNFDFTSDSKDQTVARLIILMEQFLTRYGAIPHYHTKIVGRRRDTPLQNLTSAEESRINYSNWQGLHQSESRAPTA